MSKMVRRLVHLEKPSLCQDMYEWVCVDEELESTVQDRDEMKKVINAVYREAYTLCVDCESLENPEPLFCDNCKEKPR